MKIAYGDSRAARKWKNNEISWEDFCKRVSITQYTTETVEEYRKMTQAKIAENIGTSPSYVNKIVRSKEQIMNKTFLAMMENLGFDVELHYVEREEK